MADVKKYVVIGSSAAGTNGVRELRKRESAMQMRRSHLFLRTPIFIPAAFFMHIWAVTAQKRDSASWSRILKSATE